tara:strand:+ start:62 stop:547 length:486 start_codon:yes stop_codon:yes gene_type:complete
LDILHASSIEVNGKALINEAAPKSGKSALALEMIALGAKLIADDRTEFFKKDGVVYARSPENLPIGIEARGIGILRLPTCSFAPVLFFIEICDEFSRTQSSQPQEKMILGKAFEFYQLSVMSSTASTLYLLMQHGKIDSNMSIDGLPKTSRRHYGDKRKKK